jgi:hypothetical protein
VIILTVFFCSGVERCLSSTHPFGSRNNIMLKERITRNNLNLIINTPKKSILYTGVFSNNILYPKP